MSNLIRLTAELRDALDRLPEPDGVEVYNPLRYAWQLHQRYLRRFVTQGQQTEPPFEWGGDGPSVSTQPRRVLFVGMNPGPFGMMQNGCPFGDKVTARLLGGLVGHPLIDRHTESLDLSSMSSVRARRIHGFAVKQREVSGQRFWEGLADLWPHTSLGRARLRGAGYGESSVIDPTLAIETMLQDACVVNFSPLCFISEETGKNVPSDKLPADYRAKHDPVCMHYLRQVLYTMQIRIVFGVGGYAKKLCTDAVKQLTNTGAVPCVERVVLLPHPSPASPLANTGWAALARDALIAGGLL